MSDEDALLAAINANPDDDTPRLVYADWLDENGQPEWAEFIRLQCGVGLDDTLRSRATELEVRHRSDWLQWFPQRAGAEWEFRRGFPEVLRVPGAVFLAGAGFFVPVRWVRCLCLRDMLDQTVVDFTRQHWSSRWTELELQEHPGARALSDTHDATRAIRAIAECPAMANIRRLQLSRFEVTPDGISALTSSSHLDALQYLGLNGDPNASYFAPLRERFGERLVIG